MADIKVSAEVFGELLFTGKVALPTTLSNAIARFIPMKHVLRLKFILPDCT